MKIVELSIKDYKAKWDSMKGSMRIEAPNIDPIMRTMTVQGRSGKGTFFKNEYERLHHEWLNPRMPMYIDWYGKETIRYVPKRGKII